MYEPGRVTSTTSKGPSQIGKSLCWSLVIWIFHSMKSPTRKMRELTFHAWYRLMTYWCFAEWMTAASCNSSNLVKPSTRESSDCTSLNSCTQKDLCSTSVGNIASDKYTNKNGVWLVARLGVVCKAHTFNTLIVKRWVVNQDHVEGFLTKQEYISTHIHTIN
jgi:hypothetical protein